MSMFTAHIDNAGDGWIQVTISGPTVGGLTEAAIEAALSAALSGMAGPVAFRWRFDEDAPWSFVAERPGRFRFGEPVAIEPLFATPPVSDLREENARLRAIEEAAKAVIASWDERGQERETLVRSNFSGSDYWSPAASMVSSEPIANLRAALSRPNEGEA